MPTWTIFVDALATRIASYDKWAIANTKRLVNAASLPPDVEIAAGWDACLTSIARPTAQERVKLLFEQGFHKPGRCRNALEILCGTTSSISTPSNGQLGTFRLHRGPADGIQLVAAGHANLLWTPRHTSSYEGKKIDVTTVSLDDPEAFPPQGHI
jgi:hypothetical protein